MAISGADGSIVLNTKIDESGLNTGMSKLKSGIGAIGKAFAVAGAAGIAGFAAVTKSAVQSYAEYEQLAGGVETLFKDSANTLMKYADEAYKTAGMSANEYMSTVTSFSASLLQSLGGDTEKSAEYANQAVIDMSDNANKMGTSVEMIQNAYQGFAKQNFMMLDNLKLGYGGTKEEMQRLLSDAEKMSGLEFDISSFADITKAIHIIQTELGITGTTAKEASSTIQGSFSSMKSSWQNLLTGMADENQNFDVLLENFIASVGTFLSNLLPRIQVAVNGVFNLIAGLIPQLPTLVQGLAPAILNGILSIINGIATFLPQFVETGIVIIVKLIEGLTNALPQLVEMLPNIIFKISEILLNNLDLIIDTGIGLIMALIDGLIIALPRLIEYTPKIVVKFVGALIRNLPKVLQAGRDIFAKLIEGINASFSKIGEIGTNIVKGLWNGISNAKTWLINKIKGFCNSALDGIKEFFGIHSPSVVMQNEVGAMLIKGLAQGITKNESLVNSAMLGVSKGIMNTDFSLGTLNNIPLPSIAKGTVMPYSSSIENSDTRGNSISDIKTALAEVLAQMNVRNNNGFNGRIEIPLIINGREIARAVREAEADMGKQTVFGGFANAY